MFLAISLFAGSMFVVIYRDLVSPQMYKDYLVPVHNYMLNRIGGPTILHVCGDCRDRLDIFAEEGYDGYHYEWQVETSEAVRIVDTNAIMEIDELCNKAYKRLHEMYPKSVSKRTGPWTSKEIDIQENYL